MIFVITTAEVKYAPLSLPAKPNDGGLIEDHLQYSEVAGFKKPQVRHTTTSINYDMFHIIINGLIKGVARVYFLLRLWLNFSMSIHDSVNF